MRREWIQFPHRGAVPMVVNGEGTYGIAGGSRHLCQSSAEMTGTLYRYVHRGSLE
jgi:hypothetical protein